MLGGRCKKALNFKRIAIAIAAIHQMAVFYLYRRLCQTKPLVLLSPRSFFSHWLLTSRPDYFIWDSVLSPVFRQSSGYLSMPLGAGWSIGLPVSLLLTRAMMACLTVLVSVWIAGKWASCLNDKPGAGLLVIPVHWRPSGSGV
jgi:hypothetical protein